MKTLVTVSNSELKELLFYGSCLEQLELVSEVDWVPENKEYTVEDLKRDIGPYDAVISSWGSPKITAEVLEDAPRLKFIGHAAGTLIPYVDPEAFRRDITVVNANMGLAKSTAELTIAFMMSGAWNLTNFSAILKRGDWKSGHRDTVMGLYRQKVGIVGLGEVSKEVIRLLHAFETEIYLYSPYCSKEEAEELGVELCSLEELLKKSRIISLHDTLTPLTRGMIGKEQLDLIQDGSLLVNTARGPLIDEEALINTLTSERIHAALDVFHQEPMTPDYPLLHLPNVLCVPHIGALSSYWKPRLGELVVEDLQRFVRGEPLLRQITQDRIERMTTR